MPVTAVEVEQVGPTATVTFHQRDVTHSELQEVVVECGERIRYSNAQNFVFDFAGVEFISSSCLGVLVGFMQDVEHVRGRIALANCSDNVTFLFRVTRLDSVFEIFDDAKEAAASF